MIRLTEAWEKGFYYANPEKIIMIQEHDLESGKVTYVKTDNGGVMYVTESPEEVVRKVLEWKLEMERYKAAAIVALTHRANENNPYMPPLDAQRELEILAGLEEN